MYIGVAGERHAIFLWAYYCEGVNMALPALEVSLQGNSKMEADLRGPERLDWWYLLSLWIQLYLT